jgi:hypothetical protein
MGKLQLSINLEERRRKDVLILFIASEINILFVPCKLYYYIIKFPIKFEAEKPSLKQELTLKE